MKCANKGQTQTILKPSFSSFATQNVRKWVKQNQHFIYLSSGAKAFKEYQ